MNNYQRKIKKFCQDRNWHQFHNPKDLLLGIVEEIGEFRNLIKWEQNPLKIKKVLEENQKEVEDTVGDIYWFLAILANNLQIDIDRAVSKVINENKKRFPIKKTKNRHTNINLGGHDGRSVNSSKLHLKQS